MLLTNFLFKRYSSSSANITAAQLKPATTSFKQSKIVDKIRLYVRGGSGGQGCPSSGGIGSNGGHVFIKCTKGASLRPYILQRNRRIIAEHGAQYKKGQMKMKASKNAFIVVPPGTEIKSGENMLLHDMNIDGDIIKIANGGSGGSAKTKDFNGLKGERKNISLELKTIADVALTGFPNAGKSSLLRLISRARPKVGNYPFTTINPMVGSVFYTDNSQLSVADLPGLIEDAHLNKGMGHRFLRHVERTNLITLVVDVNGFQLKSSQPYRSPIDTIILLLKELFLYQDILLDRPLLLVLNKMDTENAAQKANQIYDDLLNIKNHPLLMDCEFSEEILNAVEGLCCDNFQNVFPLSATTGEGADQFKEALYHILPRNVNTDEEYDEDLDLD